MRTASFMIRLRRLRARTRSEGVRATVAYAMVTGVLERLGLRILHVFSAPASDLGPGTTDGLSFSLVRDATELTESDTGALEDYGGHQLSSTVRRQLADGRRCVVSRFGDELAGMASLTTSDAYVPNGGREAALIEQCFTIPRFRGRAVFSSALRYALAPAVIGRPSGQPVFIECSVTNTSSTRGIKKAGFARIGTLIEWRRWAWFFPDEAGEN